MKTYIVLLRGVMPSGKNRVPMGQLKDILTNAKFSRVRTYIQSGNVILSTSLSPTQIETKVHNLIKKFIGADLVVVVKTARQLQIILNKNPIKRKDMSRVFYTIFSNQPSKENKKALLEQGFLSNELVVGNNCAYVFIPKPPARSRLNNNYLERKLKVSATTRNLNTMTKLIKICKEKP